MFSRKLISVALIAAAVLAIAATTARADSVVQLGSPSGLGAGDFTAVYPDAPGTITGSPYTTTVGGYALTFTQSGNFMVLVQGGGVSGTSWFLDYPNGMNVLYTGSVFGQGSGPVTLTFSTPVVEFGFLFQNNNDRKPASGVNSFDLYDGSTLLGTYTGTTVSTDSNGNVLLFVGAQVFGGSISQVVLHGDGEDFSTGPVTFLPDPPLNDPAAAPVPEPSTLLMFGSGLVSLGGLLRRKLRA